MSKEIKEALKVTLTMLELGSVKNEKEKAVREQNFLRALELRDIELKLEKELPSHKEIMKIKSKLL